MKRFTFLATLVAVVGAASVTYAFSNKNNKTKGLTDLQIAAIEVLSGDDDPEGGSGACYNAIHANSASMVRYCPTCSWITGAGDGDISMCGM